MIKKTLVLVFVTVLMLSFSVEAFAKTEGPVPDPISEEQLALGSSLPTPTPISGSTSVAKAARKLVEAGEYWGWKATSNKSKNVIYVTLTNSKYVWANIKVAKKNGKVAYWFKGKRYTLGGWKSSLKQYSIAADRKALIKLKAKQGADSIENYGKKQSWNAKRTTKYKSGKAYVYLDLTNAKYNYKVSVVSSRGKGKITTTYYANNQKVSAKYIKETLKKYKATKKSKKNSSAVYGSSEELPDGMTLLDNTEEATKEDADLIIDESALTAAPDENANDDVVTEELLTTDLVTDEPIEITEITELTD